MTWREYADAWIRKWRARQVADAQATPARLAAEREAAERRIRRERDPVQAARHRARVESERDSANARDGFPLRDDAQWAPSIEEAMAAWTEAPCSERDLGWMEFWRRRWP